VSATARTKVAAVIGSPVRHSLSPVIHNAAFAAHGDDWTYCAFEVDPLHAVAAVDAMRVLGIAGLSVTMPHKEMVIPALDVVDDGRLVGHNTDGVGCVDALAAAGADFSTVAVVGAGATARAVIAALASAGSQVRVANRTAARLADAVAVGNAVRAGSTTAVEVSHVGECLTVVNTTPQGMSGIAPDALPFDTRSLTSSHCVLDAVYHPLETRLIREARDRGARVVDGLDMLCAQAARQQQLWLGRLPDVALMRRAALAELAKSQQ